MYAVVTVKIIKGDHSAPGLKSLSTIVLNSRDRQGKLWLLKKYARENNLAIIISPKSSIGTPLSIPKYIQTLQIYIRSQVTAFENSVNNKIFVCQSASQICST